MPRTKHVVNLLGAPMLSRTPALPLMLPRGQSQFALDLQGNFCIRSPSCPKVAIPGAVREIK